MLQSVDINGEAAANAAKEPCRPMASIKIRAVNSRFMNWSLTGTRNRRKPSVRRVTLRPKSGEVYVRNRKHLTIRY